MNSLLSGLDWKAGFPARGGLGSTSLSAYGRLGTQLFDPYFFVYSARQRRTGTRARAVPVVQLVNHGEVVRSSQSLATATGCDFGN